MNPIDSADGARRAGMAVWLLAVFVAVLLRTIALGRWPGINGDEAWYGVNVQELLTGGTPFLQTGIGNPLNPLHSGLLLALSVMFEPSAALLRVPEVMFGLAAVVLAYPLLVTPLGRHAALLVTIMLAIAPTAVAYSRLGWDPSGTPLVTLLALAAALHDRPIAASIAVAFAYFVHPTNIFVVPIAAAAWAPHALQRYRAMDAMTRSRLKMSAIVLVLVIILLAGWAAMRVAQNPNTTLPSVSMVIDRVTSPMRWLSRGWGFINLASGVSTAAHIAAPLSHQLSAMVNAVMALSFAGCIALGWTSLRRQPYALWLIGGMAAAFAGFHVVAMDLALQPTLERYGMFMLVPMMVLLSIAMDAVTTRFRAIGIATTTAIVTLLGAMTVGAYFYPLIARGGDAMATYRTGAREPKLAAFEFIQSDSATAPVRVVAEDWFLYWTLRYFAGPNGPVHVEPVPGAQLPGGTRPTGAPEPAVPPPQRTYIVVYAGSQYPGMLALTGPAFTAFDPIGRPVLHVYSVPSLP